MPIRVVTNSHLTGDDTTLVPSVKEFGGSPIFEARKSARP